MAESPARGNAHEAELPASPRRSGIFLPLPHDSALGTVLCGIALTALLVLLLRWYVSG